MVNGWLEFVRYDCAQIVPSEWFTNSYEFLSIATQTVETQFIFCGGLGYYGFSGLFWSDNSRFFYYTSAREGAPDGGGPWTQPVSRFDTAIGKHETLELAVFSPNKQKIAGVQDGVLTIWEVAGDAVARFAGQPAENAFISWISWAPDGRSLVYLSQIQCQGGYPCPSHVTTVNLDTGIQTALLGAKDPPLIQVDWIKPGELLLHGSDYVSQWVYDLQSGRLTPVTQAASTPTHRP